MDSTVASRAAALSTRQLGLLVAISDLRSVRRASEECGLSQPATTQALAKLEQVVGARLIERRSKGSYLNDAGEILVIRARRFFGQMRDAVVQCGSVRNEAQARVLVNHFSRSQVRAFVSLVESETIDKAVAALDVTKSSLLRSIRDLETNLGLTLVHRTPAGTLVTPLGLQLGRRLKLAVQEIEWGVDEVDASFGCTNRRIVIGAMPAGASVLLASVLDRFLADHPAADVQIVNDSTGEMKKNLIGGRVDLMIGLLSGTLEPELSGLPLAPTPYSIVARKGHPLSRRQGLTVADLAHHGWIVGMPGSNRRACFDELFAAGERPVARVATCALTAIYQLLKTSDRLALLTSYELDHADQALQALPCAPIQPAPFIGLMHRADFLPTQLHQAFIDTVRAHVASRPPALRMVG